MLQNWQTKTDTVRQKFLEQKKLKPQQFQARLNLSWSNWGFGFEDLSTSVARLSVNGIDYIEIHGNSYGADLGYNARKVKELLKKHNMRVAGICGMFGPANDLSSNNGAVRQNAIDYIRRNLALGYELGAKYFLIVPAAVGRPARIDDMEFERSVETLQIVADEFIKAGIRGAVEPIRSAEVSIVHTFADAKAYIEKVNSQGIRHINGDVYHMLTEESHIAETLLTYGSMLTNLHLADTNRSALGEGSLDLDTIIMALYLVGYNNECCFCTPEPLGPGGDPYPAMFGKPDSALLDQLVSKTAQYWKSREDYVRSL